jgi:predicted outer membrane lipoprotein
VLRPTRLLALARRDLALELRGRRGWALPVIALVLLMPVASLPIGGRPPAERATPPAIQVSGAVPTAVLAVPGVQVVDDGGLRFSTGEDGATLVRGTHLPPQIRASLDGERPGLTLETVTRQVVLALIAASVLTAAVSASIAGERARRTLETLLASSATRGEIVVGKWLAWAGFGAGAAMLAAAAALATGRVELGWWLVPLPMVPAASVALGLYLVRRAADLVAGTTVSVRVLPAVLAVAGITAWILGQDNPLLGAAVPLGGALVAAGATWPGAAPPLLAAAVTGLAAAGFLVLTARDLERTSLGRAREGKLRAAVWSGVFGVGAWWAPVLGPVVWAAAGNPTLAAELPAAAGPLAGALAMLLWCLAAASRTHTPAASMNLGDARGLRLGAAHLPAAAIAGIALAASAAVSGWTSAPADPLLVDAYARLAASLQPSWAGVTVLLITVVAQELFWRGYVARAAGPLAAVVLFAAVHSPLDPLRGLLVGAILTALATRAGTLAPAIAARLVWVAAAPLAGLLGLVPATALGVATALWLGASAARRTRADRPDPR